MRFRVVVWVDGKSHERRMRGSRADAEAFESDLRARLGGKPRDYPLGSAASYVYFVRAGTRGAIKIGRTHDAVLRLSKLQVGNHQRLLLLGVVPGGKCLEGALHRAFKTSRIGGEWFRADRKLLGLIEELGIMAGTKTMVDPMADRL